MCACLCDDEMMRVRVFFLKSFIFLSDARYDALKMFSVQAASGERNVFLVEKSLNVHYFQQKN